MTLLSLLLRLLFLHLVLFIPDPVHLRTQLLEVVYGPEEVAGPRHHQLVAVVDGEVGLELGVLHSLQLKPDNEPYSSHILVHVLFQT